MKKYLCISILSFSIFFALSPVISANEDKGKTDAVSSLFINFMDESFENTDQLLVVDSDGNDVTNNFLNDTNGYTTMVITRAFRI